MLVCVICVHACVCTCMCTCMCVNVCVHVHVCVCACVCVCVYGMGHQKVPVFCKTTILQLNFCIPFPCSFRLAGKIFRKNGANS